MTAAPMRMFDADNHYYEAYDAFTRHLPKHLQHRGVQWVELENGHKRHMVGGRIDYQVPNPTFDPISKPGVLREYFRGNPDNKSSLELIRSNLEPLPPEYQDRDARLKVMDAQGVDAAWFFPTSGIHYEERLKRDITAQVEVHKAFNRWLEEDWGFNYKNRIYAAPYITLADPKAAETELEWALDKGARVVIMRPGPTLTADGKRSPGSEDFDGFWARAAEAEIVVVAHAGNTGYSLNGYPDPAGSMGALGGGKRPSVAVYILERSICDWLTSLMFDRLFERHPGVKVASVENGAAYLHDLFRQLKSSKERFRNYYTEDPVESFKNNVWINPFWEDDYDEVIEYMGVDHVLFGSDWPHMEGLAQPDEIFEEIGHRSEADQRRLVYENAAELTGADFLATV